MLVEQLKKEKEIIFILQRQRLMMGGCEDVGEISGNLLLPPQLPFLSKKFRL